MAAADSIPTPVGNNPLGLSASLGLDAAAVETSFFPKPVEIAKIEDSSHVIITFKKLDFDSPLITEPLGVEEKEEEEERDNDSRVSNREEDYLLPPPPLQRRRTAAAPHKYAKKGSSEDEELPRSVRRRVHVTYHESDSSGNGEDPDDDPGFVHQRLLPPVTNASKPKLPIGVVRGCPSCHGCQKVVATWRPDAGRKPYLDDAPVFYPEEEEFKDPLAYIASIRTKAEPFGICRVVPPQSWRPPCPLRENSVKFDEMWFPTRVQQVHKLQVREPISKETSPAKQGRKRRRGRLSLGRMGGGGTSSAVASETRLVSTKPPLTPPDDQQEFFGFEPGIPFQLGSFERYAKDFKDQYFRNTEDDDTSPEQCNASHNGEEQKWEPSIDMIEGEYWRIVEQATDQIEVLYGADVETGQFGSGFPKADPGTILDPTSYEKSGWNLNNIARQPGSMLSFEEGDISGVLVPWLYIGMCFSSFCWHVEDHHFYSLNYLHWGAPKIWYGVPSFAASKLEAVMKKHLPDLFDEQPDLLHKLVTQLSPSILKQEGVPVYRLVQQAGDYVITFPHAYHAGFNSGFNVAEAVNVAPVDWLLHGQAAVELYREQCRKTSVSHDKLLLRAARLAVKMSWWSAQQQQSSQGRERRSGGALWKSSSLLPSQLSPGSERVKMECAQSKSLKDVAGGLPGLLKRKKMDSNYDVTDERECELCKYDLHLSAISCECCLDKFSCLLHGHLLCSCPWNKKTLLYRYTLEELTLLLAAVEGKPGAVSKWTNFELQLSIPESPTRPSFHKEEEEKLQIHPPPLPGCIIATQQQPKIQQVPSNEVKPHVHDWVGRLLRTETKTEVRQQPSSSLPFADIPANVAGAFSHNLTESETRVRPSPSGGSVLVANEVIVLSDDEDDTKEQASIFTELPKEKDVALGNSSVHHQPMICVTAQMADCPFDEDTEGTSAAAAAQDTAAEVNIQRAISRAKVVCSERAGVPPPTSRELIAPFADGGLLLAGDRSNAGKCLDSAPPMTKLSYVAVATATGSVKPTTQMNAEKYDEMTTQSSPLGRQLSVHNKNNNTGTTSTTTTISSFPVMMHHVAETAKADAVIKVVHANGIQQNGCQLQQQAQGTTTIGPRVARVVRSKRSSVELLDTGCLVLRSGWHNKHVIFPAGFKSQIRFYDMIDISHSCIYVSEIVDRGGDARPLFKVSVPVSQPSSTEVFLNESVDECWREIQNRVNDVIIHRHCGHNKLQQQQQLPPLLPPLSGLEMFGLTLPTIIQAVESLDPQHQCIKYWTAKQEFGRSLKSQQDRVQRLTSVELQKQGRNNLGGCYAFQAQEPNSRSSLQEEQGSLASQQQVSMKTPVVVVTGSSSVNSSTNQELPQEELLGTGAAAEADTSLVNTSLKSLRSRKDLYPTLRGFFRKAEIEELQVLHHLFHCEMQGAEWSSGVHALTDELQTRIAQRMATEEEKKPLLAITLCP
ncbi:unnamed protein product [Sphagnum compactum]